MRQPHTKELFTPELRYDGDTSTTEITIVQKELFTPEVRYAADTSTPEITIVQRELFTPEVRYAGDIQYVTPEMQGCRRSQ